MYSCICTCTRQMSMCIHVHTIWPVPSDCSEYRWTCMYLVVTLCTRAVQAYNSLKMYMYMCTYLTSQCAHDIMAVTDCIMCTYSCEVHVYSFFACVPVYTRNCVLWNYKLFSEGFLYKVHPHWAPFIHVHRHNTYTIQLLIGCNYGYVHIIYCLWNHLVCFLVWECKFHPLIPTVVHTLCGLGCHGYLYMRVLFRCRQSISYEAACTLYTQPRCACTLYIHVHVCVYSPCHSLVHVYCNNCSM